MAVKKDKEKKPVTKLEKMSFNRIALCNSPADQDGMFVLVKAEDPETEDEDSEDDVLTPEILRKTISEAVEAAIKKSHPVLVTASGDPIGEQLPADDGGKAAIQERMRVLVKACNESRTTPKAVKVAVSEIAKFHGVEGPDVVDDGTSEKFADAITAMNTMTTTLQGVVTQMATMQQPAKPAASPTKKSGDPDPETGDEVPDDKPDVAIAVPEAVVKEHQATVKQAKETINTLRKMLGKEPVK